MMRAPLLLTVILGLLLLIPPGTAAQAPPEFQQAVQRFSARDFAGAIELLRGVTETTPEFPNGWLLLGRSLINAGQGAEARAALQHAREFPAIAGQAEYYDGLAYAIDGSMDAAFAALERAKA